MPLAADVVALCRIATHAAAAVCADGTIIAAVGDAAQPRFTTATCSENAVVEAAHADAGVLHVVYKPSHAPQQRHLQSFTLSAVRCTTAFLTVCQHAVHRLGNWNPRRASCCTSASRSLQHAWLGCTSREGGVPVFDGHTECSRCSRCEVRRLHTRCIRAHCITKPTGALPDAPIPLLFHVDLAAHLRVAPTAAAIQSVLLSQGVLGVLGWQRAEEGGTGLQVLLVW